MRTINFLTQKRRILLMLIILVFATHMFAQSGSGNESAFGKGSKTLGLAAGLGVDYGYYSGYKSLPAFTLIYDQGFWEDVGPGNIGIGGMVGIKTAHYNYPNGGYKSTWNNYIVGIRGTYHLTILKDKNNQFDPYAGIMLGVRIYKYKDTYYNNRNNPYNYKSLYFIQGAFIGAKYNFKKSFGVFAEAGYDISLVRFGLNVNF